MNEELSREETRKIKRSEVRDTMKSLEELSRLPGRAMAAAINDNKVALTKILQEASVFCAMPTQESVTAFHKAERSLAMNHCKLDANGQPQVTQQRQYVFKDPAKFEKEYEELKTQHTEAVAILLAHAEKIKSYMEEAVDVKLTCIPFESVSEQISACGLEDLEMMLLKPVKLNVVSS